MNTTMMEVTQEEFYKRLYADKRDIMPDAEEHVTYWKIRGKQVWGVSTPGWKNPAANKTYAIATGESLQQQQ